MGCSGSEEQKKANQELSKLQNEKIQLLEKLNKKKDTIIELQKENFQLNDLVAKMKEEHKKEKEKINSRQIQEGNELMNELKDLDNGEVLQANLNNLMIERQKEEENMQIMKNGNNAINNDLGINEDEYLKRILGS